MKGILHRYLITTIIGSLGLGLLLTSFVRAQQREDEPGAEKQEAPGKKDAERVRPGNPGRPQEAAPQRTPQTPSHQANTEPVTFLGIAATEVPPAVRAHLDLPRGVGISIGQVLPESPAAKAGLKDHDVLTRLDDQLLVTPEQFQILVRMKEPGDKIKLTCLSAGKERTLDITLDSRRVPVTDSRPLPHHDSQFNPHDPRQRDGDFGGSDQWRDLQREWSDKMRDWWEKNGDEISEQFRKAMNDAFEDAKDLRPEAEDFFDDLPERRERGERKQHEARPESGEKNKDPI